MSAFRPLAISILVWGSISASALADDPYNYAEVWRGWSAESRSAYMWGLKNGVSHTYVLAGANWLPTTEWVVDDRMLSTRIRRVRDEVFLQFEAETLMPVMTDLYRDPANAFIEFVEMAGIARDKIKGSDIQERLLKARKQAILNNELNERMKDKK